MRKKRLLSLLLALCLCLSLLPTAVFADTEDEISLVLDLARCPSGGDATGVVYFEGEGVECPVRMGEVNSYTFSLGSYYEIWLSLDPDEPVDAWSINEVTYEVGYADYIFDDIYLEIRKDS